MPKIVYTLNTTILFEKKCIPNNFQLCRVLCKDIPKNIYSKIKEYK